MPFSWVKGPYKLIQSPRSKLKGASESQGSMRATEMVLVHNLLIRGLNAISLQMHQVKETSDVRDFMTFIQAWAFTMHAHHESEETVIFPLLEQQTGELGIMNQNVVQHEEFLPSVKAIEDYVSLVKEGKESYDSKKLEMLLKSCATLLVRHLEYEIKTINDLDKFGAKIDWKQYDKVLQKHAVDNSDKNIEVPFIMTNLDTTFEDGLHSDRWPPFPWIAGLIFRLVFVPRNQGAWRFSTCDPNGKPRELAFL